MTRMYYCLIHKAMHIMKAHCTCTAGQANSLIEIVLMLLSCCCSLRHHNNYGIMDDRLVQDVLGLIPEDMRLLQAAIPRLHPAAHTVILDNDITKCILYRPGGGTTWLSM